MSATQRRPKRSRARRPPAPRRSRVQQGEDTRRAILDAAVALYAEGGFRGTGLIAIGQRAGVHHATVLYHYRTAKDLLLAVLEERDRRFCELSRDVRAGGGLTALAHLPLAGKFNADHPLWARLFAVLQVENLDPGAEAHEYFARRRADTHALIVQQLEEARARGEIRADVELDATADVVLAFMTGAQIQHLLAPGRVDLVATYQRFTRMLLADLAGA